MILGRTSGDQTGHYDEDNKTPRGPLTDGVKFQLDILIKTSLTHLQSAENLLQSLINTLTNARVAGDNISVLTDLRLATSYLIALLNAIAGTPAPWLTICVILFLCDYVFRWK